MRSAVRPGPSRPRVGSRFQIPLKGSPSPLRQCLTGAGAPALEGRFLSLPLTHPPPPPSIPPFPYAVPPSIPSLSFTPCALLLSLAQALQVLQRPVPRMHQPLPWSLPDTLPPFHPLLSPTVPSSPFSTLCAAVSVPSSPFSTLCAPVSVPESLCPSSPSTATTSPLLHQLHWGPQDCGLRPYPLLCALRPGHLHGLCNYGVPSPGPDTGQYSTVLYCTPSSATLKRPSSRTVQLWYPAPGPDTGLYCTLRECTVLCCTPLLHIHCPCAE